MRQQLAALQAQVERLTANVAQLQEQLAQSRTAGQPQPPFQPGGKLAATASWDGTARLWDVMLLDDLSAIS